MGALSKTLSADRLLRFPDEVAAWMGGVSVAWVRKRKKTLPGVIEESREVVLFDRSIYRQKRFRSLK